MFIKRFLMGALAVLVLFGALGSLRRGGYEDAYRAGFRDGQEAAAASSEANNEDGSETAVPPQANERNQRMDHGQRMGHGQHHFGRSYSWSFFPLAFLIGGFVKLAAFALILGGLFKFFGWGRHWRHHHKGHRPPWAKYHPEEAAGTPETPGTEKSPEDVEPDIKIG